jgi:large subunit ribosomal protein L4
VKIDLYQQSGEKKGSVEVNDAMFGVKVNNELMRLALIRQLSNARQANAHTKTRADVRGGGKKPWKQKGRGGARAGTSRSPLWVGGGTIFGPRPRDYRQELTKKMKRLARKSALSYKVKDNQIMIVEDFVLDNLKTKDFSKILSDLKITGKKVLVLTGSYNEIIYKSGRNIPKVNILEAANASTYDILNNQVLVLQKSAVDSINKTFENTRGVA